jgi:asparagine synthase (glutamine-hydrolysing)
MCTRRLRIVDPAHGEQPQASFDGRFLVSFNGEIYNHVALRQRLESIGISFKTECDTEVLANVIGVWGAAGIRELAGMYAFVAIDTATGAFLAARDPFGVKPLYFIRSDGGFLFCSEIRPLLDATESGDVQFVPPGHMMTRESCEPHYELPTPAALGPGSPRELDRILSEAVRRRIPSGLPVASLFSGGIDSTLVVHYGRQFAPAMPGYVVVGGDSPDLAFARHYADQTDLDLREVHVDVEAGAMLLKSKLRSERWRHSSRQLSAIPSTITWQQSVSIRTGSALRSAARGPTSFSPDMSPSSRLSCRGTSLVVPCKFNVWR